MTEKVLECLIGSLEFHAKKKFNRNRIDEFKKLIGFDMLVYSFACYYMGMPSIFYSQYVLQTDSHPYNEGSYIYSWLSCKYESLCLCKSFKREKMRWIDNISYEEMGKDLYYAKETEKQARKDMKLLETYIKVQIARETHFGRKQND